MYAAISRSGALRAPLFYGQPLDAFAQGIGVAQEPQARDGNVMPRYERVHAPCEEEKKGYAAKAKAKLRATVWLSGESEIP